jgi:hypothetical protein
MSEQIAHLLSGAVVCEGFTLLDNTKPVVHLEILVGNLFLENPAHVASYRDFVVDLDAVAWNSDTSRAVLARALT